MSEPAEDATLIRSEIVSGKRSVREVVDDHLARIAALDPAIGAFSQVLEERARATAIELDRALAEGAEPGPLFGVPVALKANMCLEGVETHCGSRMLAGYRPPYTATFVQRAIDAGCVVIGTTHMDEFAMGSSGENSAYTITRNPWDPTRTPGGSSSGPAAAVAAGMVPLALGSDTGGSVRQPAAFCGVSGFKPTFGRISRYGLVAFGSSLDQVSPLARSARDLERVVAALGGVDPLDATSIEALPADDRAGTNADDAPDDLRGLRVGVPREFFPDALDADVRATVERGLDELARLGAELREVSLPRVPAALPTYYVVATAEASSNLARFDGVRYGARADGDGSLLGMIAATRTAGFGDEVKRRILLGTYVLSSGYHDQWYGRAQRVRILLASDFDAALDPAPGSSDDRVDLLVGPTAPTPAFALGERTSDPVAMYMSDILTVPASLAGLPAVSIPCGFVERDGATLPIGLQLVGAKRDDLRILHTARAYQNATTHHLRTPDVERLRVRTPDVERLREPHG